MPDIERLILAGQGVRVIGQSFGLSKDSVFRHRSHMTRRIAQSQAHQQVVQDARDSAMVVEVLAREAETQEMYSIAKDMIHVAKAAGNTREVRANIKTAVAVLSEDRAHKELRGELTGVLHRGQVNVNVMTQINNMAGSLPRAMVTADANAQVIDVPAIDAPPRIYNNDTVDTFEGPDGAD